MIELSHIYKTYPGPVHALRDIDVEIEKGEFVFLTGPSGAGKTTLFRMICGYDKPTSGVITVAGTDLTKVNAREIAFFRRKIGVVFQDYKLIPSQTVFDNIALPLRIRGDKDANIKKKVMQTLEQVGLEHKWDEFPESLSGGEQQRTAIARGIIHQPGVLIADEPTGNLDPKLSSEIMDLFERVSEQGTTVFIATHDHRMVQERGHRHIRIGQGVLEC